MLSFDAQLQLILIFLFCFIEIAYLVLVRPYDDCVVNMLSVLNQVLYFVSIFIYMWFQKTNKVTPRTNEFMGYMASVLLMFMIACNLCLIFPLTVYQVV